MKTRTPAENGRPSGMPTHAVAPHVVPGMEGARGRIWCETAELMSSTHWGTWIGGGLPKSDTTTELKDLRFDARDRMHYAVVHEQVRSI